MSGIDLNQALFEKFKAFVSQKPNVKVWVCEACIDYLRMTKDAGGGVYFHLRDNGCLYVGETGNLRDRTSRHFLHGVRLQALAFIPMPTATDFERLEVETEMIQMGIKAGFTMDNAMKMLPQPDFDPLMDLFNGSRRILRTARKYDTWARTLGNPENRWDGMKRYRAQWNDELERLWSFRSDIDMRLVDRFIEAIPGKWRTFQDSWKFILTEKRLEIALEGETSLVIEDGVARLRLNEIVLITAFGHVDAIHFPGIDFKAIDLYWMWATGPVRSMHRMLEEDWAALAIYRFI